MKFRVRDHKGEWKSQFHGQQVTLAEWMAAAAGQEVVSDSIMANLDDPHGYEAEMANGTTWHGVMLADETVLLVRSSITVFADEYNDAPEVLVNAPVYAIAAPGVRAALVAHMRELIERDPDAFTNDKKLKKVAEIMVGKGVLK